MRSSVCHLEKSVGGAEPCPGPGCPFWASDGLGAGCDFQRLDVEGRQDLARFLLAIRGGLESVHAQEEAAAARRFFYQRLNAGQGD